ncbi:hypothetical protein HELRODRAFT_177603 [Helobdella robusta]|uniref:Corticotropin-releasing factor domain-containing protein n=1 Tax=Helobdella robusta TaxID=6412 RepID=T1FBX4_HELRO|nr:hypothetical protein HELRODRAFT_177603 [Helobdella robusta]ESN97938.1 hypothetical protein HELRODRAFT_177603 [Helobdella robusta]
MKFSHIIATLALVCINMTVMPVAARTLESMEVPNNLRDKRWAPTEVSVADVIRMAWQLRMEELQKQEKLNRKKTRSVDMELESERSKRDPEFVNNMWVPETMPMNEYLNSRTLVVNIIRDQRAVDIANTPRNPVTSMG